MSRFRRAESAQSFVAQGKELGLGLGEGGLKFLEQSGGGMDISGAAEVFELLGELDQAFGAQVKAHALEGVGVEGQHRPIVNGLLDLGEALRCAFQEQFHKFLERARALGGRRVAQFEEDAFVEQVVGGTRSCSLPEGGFRRL